MKYVDFYFSLISEKHHLSRDEITTGERIKCSGVVKNERNLYFSLTQMRRFGVQKGRACAGIKDGIFSMQFGRRTENWVRRLIIKKRDMSEWAAINSTQEKKMRTV